MALHIDNAEVDRLLRELTQYTGETAAQAVAVALRERIERQRGQRRGSLAEELVRLGKECAALPVLDGRPVDELPGYDEDGLPSVCSPWQPCKPNL